ncbi:endolytic transglycosylase MltG [Spongiactinospora gelatinilytica]|uniref:Endolytic murein transglycosylase n=1 Tax=Spongiactinospora gelatinilytica TaxID=2666298 RepID=A0A2W2GNU7_9ACTN|nr:endolytic transglycosylase MltG [Spongiactinospora gelatinilytica]PZG49512.1 endolytic transglycosylase MltG [Spongiactinospora gelatinilytica]
MNDLDMDFLLGTDDDDERSRRRGRSSSGRGRGRRRRRRRNRGGFLAPMLAVIILLGIIGGGGYYGYQWLNDVMVPDDFVGKGTGEIVVEVRQGASAAEIADLLEKQGIVASARAFTNAADAAGKSGSLQPGEYKMRKRMAAAEAVTLLDPSKRLLAKITIREGLRVSQILGELSKRTKIPVEEFEAAAKTLELPRAAKGKLEGYAFPATYEITPKTTPTEILSAMVDRYGAAAEQAGMQEAAKELRLTQHQLLTIASIVQAESGRASDMPKVAKVIYNRLAQKPPMRLQMDSTTMYGLNKYGIAASNADLASKSPYNTYQIDGLPPGPISNPGDHAIQAALNPADGDWLYFVTTDPKQGITKFTTNYDEFLRFKSEFEKNYQGG